MALYLNKIPICRRSLDEGFIRNRDAGETFATGAIERDYDVDPVEMNDSPAGIQILPDDDGLSSLKSQETNGSALWHMYVRNDQPAFVNLDQGSNGYCWSYSTAHAVMMDRVKQNLPPVRISGAATAAIIKKGRNEGGWNGLSMKWAREHGYAVEGTGPGEWPEQSRNLKYDTPELRASMALHKSEESWYDLGRREYDQVLAKRQIITLATQNIPMPADWMRHGHSMLLISCVVIDGRAHPMVLNSWRGWGWHGLGILYDQWPDNATALRASTPSDR